MTRAHPSSSRPQHLKSLADEYRSRGYEVVIEPRDEHLPRFLKGAAPDLLARRGDEARIVEVRNRWARRDEPPLRALAEAVEAEPGWALDVVLLEDQPEPWPLAEARRKIEEAKLLLNERHPEAALLLGWSALEAAVRLYAGKEKITLERDDPAYLIKRLAHEGDLDRETFHKLHAAFQTRNAVAHGHRAKDLERWHAEVVLDLAGRLLQHARPKTTPLGVLEAP